MASSAAAAGRASAAGPAAAGGPSRASRGSVSSLVSQQSRGPTAEAQKVFEWMKTGGSLLKVREREPSNGSAPPGVSGRVGRNRSPPLRHHSLPRP